MSLEFMFLESSSFSLSSLSSMGVDASSSPFTVTFGLLWRDIFYKSDTCISRSERMTMEGSYSAGNVIYPSKKHQEVERNAMPTADNPRHHHGRRRGRSFVPVQQDFPSSDNLLALAFWGQISV